MRYELAKFIYDVCGYDKSKWTSKEANEIAKKIANIMNENKILKNMGYVNWEIESKNHVNKSYYDNLVKNIKRCLEGNQGFLEKKGEVESYFNIEDERKIEFKECIFIYFFLVESDLITSDNYTFFCGIMKIAGYQYDPKVFEDMEGVTLGYVLDKGLKIESWISLLNNWYYIRSTGNYQPDFQIKLVDEIKNLTYEKLVKIIDTGLVENEKKERETKYSIYSMRERYENQLKESVDKYDSIEDILGNELIKHVLNTEIRRRFYWLRLIEKIVYKQIKDITESFEAFKTDEKNLHYREELSNAISRFWGEKERKETDFKIKELVWSEVAKNPNKISKYEVCEIENDLKKSRITAGKIATCFNNLLDGLPREYAEKTNDIKMHFQKGSLLVEERERPEITYAIAPGMALEKYKERYIAHFWAEGDSRFRKEAINPLELFGNDEDSIFGKDKGEKSRPGEDRIRRLLFGIYKYKKKENQEDGKEKYIVEERPVVTRYMLLLTGLIAKVLIGETIDKEYISKMLENARFISKFGENDFEQYIIQTWSLLEKIETNQSDSLCNTDSLKKRVEILQNESRILEEKYLMAMYDKNRYLSSGCAVFREVLFGRKVD